MTNIEIRHIILSVFELKREPIALKVWKETPTNIPCYQGNAFPGMCTQIAEVLTSGTTFYTTGDHCFCTGGVVATGVVPPITKEDREEIIKVHFSISKGYKDIATAFCYEENMEKLIPRVTITNAAVQIGRLHDITDPDVVLIFCTPAAADILSRAYCYDMGEPIQGFAGNGACPFLIQYPFVIGKPSFSCSDVSWRKYIGLTPDEMTFSFPFHLLTLVCNVLPDVAHAYRRYGEVTEQ
ncbi:MAG: DUF169 domain-containing protein [Desulfobacterota bacterium]|nr:DUF169 domain-containing protein [Thermodesulfobacteriota bacterium]